MSKSNFNLDGLIKYYNLNLQSDNNKYYGVCPFHENADNPNGFAIYKDSGIWRCFTHNCHEQYGKTLAGLVKALVISTGIKLDKSIKLVPKAVDQTSLEMRNFIKQSRILSDNTKDYSYLLKDMKIPSQYYLERGYTEEVLIKYNVGRLYKPNHPFNGYTIVPILDTYCDRFIGYTARIELSKCLVCGKFHDLNRKCPIKAETRSKWLHSTGLKTTRLLYNYCFAKGYINNSNTIVIAESPGSVWRLEESGIQNSVAIFGSNISQQQIALIQTLNISTIITCLDNDEAGSSAKENIIRQLGNDYQYQNITVPANDLGEMLCKDVKELFKNVMQVA